ncbi:hypothetical protein KEM55_004949 [Ascosphaera atra]|nr:hypothetical protein KEM55_004949 [Ascosphaera atra]
MGLNAMDALLVQTFPDIAHSLEHLGLLGHGHGHSHSHVDTGDGSGVNINAAWLAAGSILIKETLYHATMKVARERKSSVLASNAVHHRIDSLTSIVALVTIGGAHILPAASWLDPVGGLLISAMVIRAGYANTKSSVLELADAAVDPQMTKSVQKAGQEALEKLPESLLSTTEFTPSSSSSSSTSGRHEDSSEAHQQQLPLRIGHVSGVKAGQNYLMEMSIIIPQQWTVARMHDIESHVREAVAKVRGVKRLRVNFVPETAIADGDEHAEQRQLAFQGFIEQGFEAPEGEEVKTEHAHGAKSSGREQESAHRRR